MAAANDLGPAEGPDPQIFDELAAMLDAMPSEVDDKPGAVDEPRPQPPEAAPETPLPVPVTPPDRERAADPPSAEPARVASVQAPPPPPPKPVLPPEPVPPNYWGAQGLVAVYWIAIVTGAIGQLIFFGGLFDLGWPGYCAAALIATTSETIMVASGDTALKLRAQGRAERQWVPFLLIAFLAAAAASGMNLTHWFEQNVSMAILFGGISFLGFLLHVIHGMGEGTQYLEEKATREAVKHAIEEEQCREYEAARRAQEKATQAEWAPPSVPAPARVQPVKPAPKPTTRATSKSSGRTSGKSESQTLTKELALQWAGQGDGRGPAEIREHFAAQGYRIPDPRTLRRWLNGK